MGHSTCTCRFNLFVMNAGQREEKLHMAPCILIQIIVHVVLLIHNMYLFMNKRNKIKVAYNNQNFKAIYKHNGTAFNK